MPVILDPADYPAWLGETPATGEELQALPLFSAELMLAHEIGLRIGNVKNDDAALIEWASAAQMPE
jgi:putative SOS response-associated peptidase YedK